MKAALAAAFVCAAFLATGAEASADRSYDGRIDHMTARAEGSFFIVTSQFLNLSGDLLRDLTLWHIEMAFYIPRLQSHQTLDLGFGVGNKTAYGSWEASYSLALPKANVGGEIHTLQMHNVEINGRSFFIQNEVIHPYGLLGIDLSLLMTGRGAYLRGNPLTAIYAGGGVNVGGGIILDLSPKYFLAVEALYRVTVFLYGYGEGPGRDINYLRVGVMGGPEFGRLLRMSSLGLSVKLGFML